MIEVSSAVFKGTARELKDRVTSFKAAVTDHSLTVGVPAPREDDLIERLARSPEGFKLVEKVAEAEASIEDPVEKLRTFLAVNPDVLALIDGHNLK